MSLSAAKEVVLENLGALEAKLDLAVGQGMVDVDSTYYNELSAFIDDVSIVKSWEELAEIIYKAKILEVDIDTWLSLKGETTISLEWPSQT